MNIKRLVIFFVLCFIEPVLTKPVFAQGYLDSSSPFPDSHAEWLREQATKGVGVAQFYQGTPAERATALVRHGIISRGTEKALTIEEVLANAQAILDSKETLPHANPEILVRGVVQVVAAATPKAAMKLIEKGELYNAFLGTVYCASMVDPEEGELDEITAERINELFQENFLEDVDDSDLEENEKKALKDLFKDSNIAKAIADAGIMAERLAQAQKEVLADRKAKGIKGNPSVLSTSKDMVAVLLSELAQNMEKTFNVASVSKILENAGMNKKDADILANELIAALHS